MHEASTATLATLLAARDLLADPSRWIGHVPHAYLHAVDASGAPCSCVGDDAARYTLTGAIVRASTDLTSLCLDRRTCQHVELRVADAICPGAAASRFTIDEWHSAPERTHADVLAVLDAAIAAERAIHAQPEVEA